MDFIFKYPQFLYAIVVVPVVVFLLRYFNKPSVIETSFFSSLKDQGISGRHDFLLPPLLRTLAFSLMMVALAQPLAPEKEVQYSAKTVDIMLAMDISGSMRAEDFHPHNRLFVAKEEASRFIKEREFDRIGLVVFARKSFTQCPLTLDHDVLVGLLSQVEIGAIQDGTAVGLAIANAVNRLTDSDAKSKVIILLTDGENNSGQIDPLTAAEIAKTMGIRVYTIGVGKGGLVPYPDQSQLYGLVYKNVRLDVDEDTLKKIASITGGLYFRARDQEGLREVYRTIDQLEKTEITVKEYVNFQALYQYPLLAALCLLLVEILLRHFVLIKIP